MVYRFLVLRFYRLLLHLYVCSIKIITLGDDFSEQPKNDYGRKMFTSKKTLLDVRILLVVPVGVFMIYYETFWFFHGLLTRGNRR